MDSETIRDVDSVLASYKRELLGSCYRKVTDMVMAYLYIKSINYNKNELLEEWVNSTYAKNRDSILSITRNSKTVYIVLRELSYFESKLPEVIRSKFLTKEIILYYVYSTVSSANQIICDDAAINIKYLLSESNREALSLVCNVEDLIIRVSTVLSKFIEQPNISNISSTDIDSVLLLYIYYRVVHKLR